MIKKSPLHLEQGFFDAMFFVLRLLGFWLGHIDLEYFIGQ